MDEILKKFTPEFIEKYGYDTLFYSILQRLRLQDDPYSIIEYLIKLRESEFNNFQEALERKPMSIVVTTERLEQIKKNGLV
ncbi:hypothetical protein [Chryseobacterium sp.]|uniref:hypothetical protein n=1 Tax=Chryseobacterium sp. TaxID=1871047 RepID=UPI000EC13DD9|nr:hypothetical protein [Chryseobacterium sp.]HCM34118.1 hypothetical protein [Chryseobacterium sp.]